MHDFKYPELVSDNPRWEPLVNSFSEIKSSCLGPLAMGFAMSLVRSSHFAMLPAEMSFQRWRDDRLQANAVFRATGRGDIPLLEATEIELTPEMLKHWIEQIAEFEGLSAEHQNMLRFKMGLGWSRLFFTATRTCEQA